MNITGAKLFLKLNELVRGNIYSVDNVRVLYVGTMQSIIESAKTPLFFDIDKNIIICEVLDHQTEFFPIDYKLEIIKKGWIGRTRDDKS